MTIIIIIVSIFGIMAIAEIINKPRQEEKVNKWRQELQTIKVPRTESPNARSHVITMNTRNGYVHVVDDFEIDPILSKLTDRLSGNLRKILADPSTFIIIETGNHTITLKTVTVFGNTGHRIHWEEVNTRKKEPGLIAFLERHPSLQEYRRNLPPRFLQELINLDSCGSFIVIHTDPILNVKILIAYYLEYTDWGCGVKIFFLIWFDC